jgi:hypothetical protein
MEKRPTAMKIINAALLAPGRDRGDQGPENGNG